MRPIKYNLFLLLENKMLYRVENLKDFHMMVNKEGRYYQSILLPFINKLDIHGNEIYQGDILRDTTDVFRDIIVTYDENSDSWIDQWGCEYIYTTLKQGKFEIIGNVFQNPKLRKELM